MTKQGNCPECKGEGCLTYKDKTVFDNDMMGFYFTCDNCGIKGVEWYTLIFCETEINDEESEEQEKKEEGG